MQAEKVKDPLNEVFEIVKREFYPNDSENSKIEFLRIINRFGYLTLQADRKGTLEGFLILYRTDGDFLNKRSPYPKGQKTKCDALWIRPDLRGTKVIKQLIKKAISAQPDLITCANEIFFEREKSGKLRRFKMGDWLKKFGVR